MSTAVAEPPVEAPPAEQANKPKPRRQPPYAVVVLNDDLHTYHYVIFTLMKVFGYDEVKSYQLARLIDTDGRARVWTGTLEGAELKRDLIRSAGPDLFAAQKVEFPLGVELEPLPN